MPRLSSAAPKYRRHKATGQAMVTLGGRDHYLGKYNSAASKETYRRLIAEHLVTGGVATNRSAVLRVEEEQKRLPVHPRGWQTGEALLR